ncbi:MAG: FadR family transcriptional regulator [Firmicutes bacterium]|nr:FadR family transcriptional regulator [Bacillota bacterium]
MIIQPIEKNKLSHQITESLLGMITDGTLVPGQKLPTEMELATSYNVSRNVIRESLKTLELLGIVESKTSRGTFILDNVETIV